MSTTIYTMTHKAFNPPEDKTYVPLHVGREGKADLGYLGDNTGDNISDLNCFYGELTGVYWLWLNRTIPGNVGICHYRRFFINDKQELLTEKDFDEILSEYDIITSKAMYCDKDNYRDYYAAAHNVFDLDMEGEVIKEIFPEYYDAFVSVMAGKKHYFGNLMVTSSELFDEYCNWLFNIFAVLGDRIDVSSYDEYHRRIYGFLSEQLLLVWVTAKGLKVYESRIGITEEKAETKELKQAVSVLLKDKKVSEARSLFTEILAVRPDIRLEHSDLRGEIPIIEQLLYIFEEEKKAGIDGELTATTDLISLINVYRDTLDILRKFPDISAEDKEYLSKNKVSKVMLQVIKLNNSGINGDVESIMALVK